MAQVTEVTSEALQSLFGRLLPSQSGFGEDLQASNVITPIIDLTATAEGSILREDLQTSATLTDITNYDVTNSNSTVVSTPGFYKFVGNMFCTAVSAGDSTGTIAVTDGSTTKNIYKFVGQDQTTTTPQPNVLYDFVVCLSAGESIKITSDNNNMTVNGYFRQIADINGNFTNPSGFVNQ